MSRHDRKERTHDEYGQSWMIAMCLAERPMTLPELQEQFMVIARRVGFYMPGRDTGGHRRRGLEEELGRTLEQVIELGWVVEQDARYMLTPAGEVEAEKALREAQRGWKQILQLTQPENVSRATLVVHLLLAALKLPAGLLSGSVALINDGVDTLLDGLSSLLVYFGLHFDRERVVNAILVVIMLVTGGLTFYHAVERFFVPFEPAVDWFTFTATIVSALVCAGLWVYQRYVGIRSGSLALITQSVDSRNHVIIAGSVIAGLIASMLNFGLLDTLVGLAVAILILKSAIELGVEVIRSLGEEDVDFSHYKMGLVERYDRFRQSQFRDWMLYLVDSEGGMPRSELLQRADEALDYGDNVILRALDLHEQEGADEMIEVALSELFESEWLAGEEQIRVTEAGSARVRKRLSRRRHGREDSTWHPGRRHRTSSTTG